MQDLIVTLRSTGAGAVTVQGDPSTRVMTLKYVTLELSGFELIGRSAGKGGGMSLESVLGTLEDVEIVGNSASVSGGGVYLNNSPVTFRDCLIADNTAGEGGGGVYGYEADFTMEACAIQSNSSTSSPWTRGSCGSHQAGTGKRTTTTLPPGRR